MNPEEFKRRDAKLRRRLRIARQGFNAAMRRAKEKRIVQDLAFGWDKLSGDRLLEAVNFQTEHDGPQLLKRQVEVSLAFEREARRIAEAVVADIREIAKGCVETDVPATAERLTEMTEGSVERHARAGAQWLTDRLEEQLGQAMEWAALVGDIKYDLAQLDRECREWRRAGSPRD